MTPVFADTGYWIAMNSAADILHEKAYEITQALGERPIVTSQMVLTEFLDGAATHGVYERQMATGFVRALAKLPVVRIVPNAPELFDAALELYSNRLDKGWSLTDCASFIICYDEGITETLAHDQHFVQAGFVALLRSPL